MKKLLVVLLLTGCATARQVPDRSYSELSEPADPAIFHGVPLESHPAVIQASTASVPLNPERWLGFLSRDGRALGPLNLTGSITPTADNTYSLGTSSLRWANVHSVIVSTGNIFSQTQEQRIQLGNGSNNAYRCTVANSGTNGCHYFQSATTLSGNTNIAVFNRGDNTDTRAVIHNDGFYIAGPGTQTIADNAVGASAATATITPEAESFQITCSDADGCNVTLGETGVPNGARVTFINVGTNTVNFADTAGVSELTAAFAAGQWDTISVLYVVDRWVETARANN